MKEIFSEVLKITEDIKIALTYKEMFNLLGIDDLLKDQMSIDSEEMPRTHIDIFMKAIKDFVKKPLFKDINLEDDKDLVFLRDNIDFKGMLDEVVTKIQQKLAPYQEKILNFLQKFSSKSKVSLEDIMKAVKLDKTSLLFTLEDLKKRNEIYDYNGREVTLP